MDYSKSSQVETTHRLTGMFERLVAFNDQLQSSRQALQENVTCVLKLMQLGLNNLPHIYKLAPFVVAGAVGGAATSAAMQPGSPPFSSMLGGALLGAALGVGCERISAHLAKKPARIETNAAALLELAAREPDRNERMSLLLTAAHLPITTRQAAKLVEGLTPDARKMAIFVFLPAVASKETNQALPTPENRLLRELKSIINSRHQPLELAHEI